MKRNKSYLILKAIREAKKILINVHPHADLDSISSALAFKKVIEQIDSKKKILIVSPEVIKEDFSFLGEEVKNIKVINFSSFDFSSFDLFLILDASSDDRVTGSKKIFLPKSIKKIVVDHHLNNRIVADIKLINEEACATCEILFKLFSDWQIKIDRYLATLILAGMVGDTVFFRYFSDVKNQWKMVEKLLALGADFDLIKKNFFSYSFSFVKFLGEFLRRLKIDEGRVNDKKTKFAWAAMSFTDYQQFGLLSTGQSFVADLFLAAIKEVDFGFLILEKEKNKLSLSFRSKEEINVAEIAQRLGGGGHKNAAGATVEGEFEKMVEEILKVVKSS
jgi:phosphoesterase RecJ-like protein